MLRIDTISALEVPEYGVELELGLVSFEHYVIDVMGPEAADTLMRHLMGQSIHEASALGLSVDLERLHIRFWTRPFTHVSRHCRLRLSSSST